MALAGVGVLLRDMALAGTAEPARLTGGATEETFGIAPSKHVVVRLVIEVKGARAASQFGLLLGRGGAGVGTTLMSETISTGVSSQNMSSLASSN